MERRHVHPRGSITWTPKLSASPGTVGEYLQQPEVLGTAVSVNESGTPVLTVYVDRDAAKAGDVIRDLPKNVDGIDVQVHLTDKFRSMRGNPHGGSSHTALQTPPIQLGTSGGWSKDLANGYCRGGTLGSLVQIGSTSIS